MQTYLTENIRKAIEPAQGRRLMVAGLITGMQELQPLAHEYRPHLQATAIFYQLRASETKTWCVYGVYHWRYITFNLLVPHK